MTNKQLAIMTMLVPFLVGSVSSYGAFRFYDGAQAEETKSIKRDVKRNTGELNKYGELLPDIKKIISKEEEKDGLFKSLNFGINRMNNLLARIEEREKSRDKMIEDAKDEREKLTDKFNALALKVERIQK